MKSLNGLNARLLFWMLALLSNVWPGKGFRRILAMSLCVKCWLISDCNECVCPDISTTQIIIYNFYDITFNKIKIKYNLSIIVSIKYSLYIKIWISTAIGKS